MTKETLNKKTPFDLLPEKSIQPKLDNNPCALSNYESTKKHNFDQNNLLTKNQNSLEDTILMSKESEKIDNSIGVNEPEIGNETESEIIEGKYPLCIATKLGRLNLVKKLIKNKEFINQTDSDQNMPIHYSCLIGYSSLTKLLLEHGADYNAQNYNQKRLLVMIHLFILPQEIIIKT